MGFFLQPNNTLVMRAKVDIFGMAGEESDLHLKTDKFCPGVSLIEVCCVRINNI